MWRNAVTKNQKMLVINQLIPMTLNDYNDAIFFFCGDEDEEIREIAFTKLSQMEDAEIIKRIPKIEKQGTISSLLRLSATKHSPRVISALVNSVKITEEEIEKNLFVENKELWDTLLQNRNFVALTYSFQEKVSDFLEKLSLQLKDSYLEQLSYIEPVSEEKEEESEFTEPDLQEEYQEEKEEEEIDLDTVSLDIPDFMLAEQPFEGLSAEEIQEKRMAMAEIIRNMNMAQKIKLAGLGNQEARKILIKDPRRQIAMAVIQNPRITDSELISLASSTSVASEIISHIANSKELTKNYMVKVNLVLNPKTPLRVAMQFLSIMRLPDLKKVAQSKNITSALRNAAKQKLR